VLNPPPEAAKGLVAVRLGSSTDASGARTIIAPETPVFSMYELAFTRSGAAVETRLNVTPADLVGGIFEVELDAGNWTVVVKAYRNIILDGLQDNYLAAEGNASFEVSSGGTNAVTVDIKPIAFTASGAPAGIFSYAITLPNAATTATLTVGRVEPINLLTAGTSGSLELDAGTYDLRVSLENVDGLTTGLYDLVYIYSGLETKATLELQALEFGADVFLAGTASAGAGVSFPVTITAYSDNTHASAIDGAHANVTTDGGSWLIKVPAAYIGQSVYLKAVPTVGTGVALATVELLPAKGKAGITLTLDAANSPYVEGVYIGLISFAGSASDLTGGGPILLDSSGKDTLIGYIDNNYTIASQSGTVLFYSVHKALANLTSNEPYYPANLDSVNVITFTDGLDNGTFLASNTSPIEGQTGVASDDYATYVQQQIANRLISGKSITAYSAGVVGSDVDPLNIPKFTADLAKIASPGKSSTLNNFAQIQTQFEAIANGLVTTTSSIPEFMITTPGFDPGTTIRMTFDVTGTSSAQANASAKYIEGTMAFSSGAYSLTNISYAGGIDSASGTGPITGTINGSEVTFVLTSVTGYNKATDDALAKQWSKGPSASTWQVNSEYDASNAPPVEITEHRSSIIYLVLDASTSLNTTEIGQIKAASIAFIESLYTQINQTEEAPSTAPSAPSGVTATAASSSSVNVSWDSVSGAVSYKVYHSSSASGPYTLDGTSLSTSYTATGFSGGNTGYFKVKAVNAAGEASVYSAVASATAPFTYTVTYNANGASGTVPAAQTVNSGSSVTLATQGGLAYAPLVFAGWNTSADGTGIRYASGSSLTLSSSLTLYAQWAANQLEGLSLNAALAWIAANAQNGDEYTIELTISESLAPTSLSYSGKVVGITLKGIGSEKMILLSSSGSLFTIGTGVTLTLDDNITLKGRTSNSAAVVTVQANGFLVMNDGAKIIDNIVASYSYGGGVYSSGTFTMNGGTISGNTVRASSSDSYGGGVYSSGTFTMNGGTISGNTTSSSYSSSYGGGVYSSGTFTMSGGTISGNTASGSYPGRGGGVYVSSGTFTKSSTGGTIYGSDALPELQNTAYSTSYGHAVYVNSSTRRRNTTVNAGDYLSSASSEGWD
jgi:hypothetical protein